MNIFLSPHPDDICFSAFLAIKEKDPSNPPVIITVFNKTCWRFDAPVRSQDAARVTSVRAHEERTFAASVEATVKFLEFEDSSLRYRFLGDEYKNTPTEDHIFPTVEKTIHDALERYDSIGKIYIPLGISNHVDHLICREAVFRHHHLRNNAVLYEDLPYVASFSEENIRVFVGQLCSHLANNTLHTPSVKEKTAAMSFYRSQLEEDTISTVIKYGVRLGNNTSLAERYWSFETLEKEQ